MEKQDGDTLSKSCLLAAILATAWQEIMNRSLLALKGNMEQPQELTDRRRYERRGMAVPAEIQGRGPCDSTLSTLHKQLVKRYGEGWEVDSVYPGAICDTAQAIDMEEGHMVIFKRRRQLRDE